MCNFLHLAIVVINSASTYGLAARAIGLGTLLSISSVGLLIGMTAKVLDIHSVAFSIIAHKMPIFVV